MCALTAEDRRSVVHVVSVVRGPASDAEYDLYDSHDVGTSGLTLVKM
jgi:hypothetical protein